MEIIPIQTVGYETKRLSLCLMAVKVLVEWQVSRDGVDLLGGKRLECKAGERCLAMELGETGIAHESHGKALLPALLCNVE